MEPCKHLGQLLLEAGYITAVQLEKALGVQRQTHERLGSALIHLGYITETALLELLELQLGVKRISLAVEAVDQNVARLIPHSLAEKYQIIPVEQHAGVILLAMADPTDFLAIEDVRITTGSQVKPVLAAESEIIRAIHAAYPPLRFQQNEPVTKSVAVEEASVVTMINMIVSQAIREKASDIHWEPQKTGLRVRLRIDGFLREIAVFPRHIHAPAISRIKILSELDIAEKRIPQDGRIKVHEMGREVDIRVSTLPTIFGEKAVMRILDKQAVVFDVNQLGLTEEALKKYQRMYHQP